MEFAASCRALGCRWVPLLSSTSPAPEDGGQAGLGSLLWASHSGIRLNLCNSRLGLCAVPFPRAAAPPGLGASSAEHSGPEQPLLLSSRVLWPWCAAPSWGSLSKGSLHVLPSVCFQGNVAGTQAGAAVEIWQRVPVRLQFQ